MIGVQRCFSLTPFHPRQIGTLVNAKNSTHRRMFCPTALTETVNVEHWGFDKKGAQRSWLTTDGQFRRCFDGAVSRVSAGASSSQVHGVEGASTDGANVGKGCSSPKNAIAPYAKAEKANARISEMRLDLQQQRPPSSPLGPDELPPPIPAEVLVH